MRPCGLVNPPGYDCPFCRLQQGVQNERNQAGDVIAVTELAYARISPKWWPENAGAALVIPRAHVENLYDIPHEVGHALWDLTALVAPTMRSVYDAMGRQPGNTTSRPEARTSGTFTSTSSRGTPTTGSTFATPRQRMWTRQLARLTPI